MVYEAEVVAMKRRQRSTFWLSAACGAAVSVLSVTASGQVATPPPAAPAPTPEYAPPPTRTPGAAPTAAPRPKSGPINTTLPGGGPMVDGQVPNIPFERLAVRDENGALKPLPMPMEIMALDRNPTVGDVTMYRLKPYLRERKVAMENIAINNLDMIQQIEGGVIDRLDIRKKEELIALTEMLRPLTAPGPLATDLRKRDLLTKMQTGMNQKITKQYQTELIADIKTKAKSSGADEATEVTKVLLYNSLDEVMYSYKVLLLETGKRLAGGPRKDEEYLALAKKHLEPMSRESRQAELRKTMALRPPPTPDGPPPEKPKGGVRAMTEQELKEYSEKIKRGEKPPPQPLPK